MRTLNLGIVAHVDAGKTSLTERLLYHGGVIDAVGRVDHGTTQTDTLAIEQERGITVKSAVVSFTLGDTIVNLIDTPGHPDFIAEVDRALRLLDGAILVVSAVEGVQAQTRVLWHALTRLGIPTIIFVNKIDRRGADPARVVATISERLSKSVVALQSVEEAGTANAEVADRDSVEVHDELTELLADIDEHVLANFVSNTPIEAEALQAHFQAQTWAGRLYPVLFGSAMTGSGIAELMTALTEYLPCATASDCASVSGVVFKIAHSPSGERFAIVRMRLGTLRLRDHVLVGASRRLAKVTKIAVFEDGTTKVTNEVGAGRIARVSGLGAVHIGDVVGEAHERFESALSPPLFTAVVLPTNDRGDDDRRRLRLALERLATEDPLINLQLDEALDELSVSFYGDVQRDVISDTLARDFGLSVEFRDTTTIHIERLVGSGEATEIMLRGRSAQTPFLAGVGLRIEPRPPGSGVEFFAGDEPGRLPMAFIRAVEEGARNTLRFGLHGWGIPDCAVTMTASGYFPRQSHAHATFDKNMSSIASDFRLLTPLVVLVAIRSARVGIYEPAHRFDLEVPREALGASIQLLASLGAVLESTESVGSFSRVRGQLPAAQLPNVRQHLPGLTGGEGSVTSEFDCYQPAHHRVDDRRYLQPDPRDRTNYLRALTG